jgi:hypothetical protein
MSRMHPVFILLAAAVSTTASETPGISTEDIAIEFAPRTPDQLMSFYEARGFPSEMIDILSKQCFITVRIHNKSSTKIWHELGNWHFSHNGRPLQREHRNYWLDKWRAMDMPLASISTFRWTLLPETLDYLPDEEEGGNIILPRVDGPISVKASFATGDDRQGKVIDIEYDRLYCAEDSE